ncbi:MAG: hypothetical protein ACOY0T_37370 [Myxococcota bacterium]
MRLEYARFHNIGPFRDFVLNLGSLDPSARLVALVGKNGDGKSFTLETAVPGALYRRMKTHGTLVGRATARDSFLESRLVVGGKAWTIRHALDGIDRNGEATVWGADGEPAYEGSSVRSFDRWAKEHLLPEDVLFSTLFVAQRSLGFIDLKSADRISVILQVIGVAELERMAERARKHAAEERGKLEALRVRIQDARAGVLAPDAARAAKTEAEEIARRADLELERISNALREAEAQELQRAGRRELVARARHEAEKRVAAIDAVRARLTDIEERIANNRKILANAAAVSAAVDRVQALRPALEKADRAVGTAEQKLALARADVTRLTIERASAMRAVSDAEQAVARLESRLRSEVEVKQAAARLPALQDALTAAASALLAKETELEELRGVRLSGAEERLSETRAALGRIAGSPPSEDLDQAALAPALDELRLTAEAALDADDQAVQQAAETPRRLATLAADVQKRKAEHVSKQRAVSDAERLAARAADIAAARAEHAEASKLIERAAERRSQATTALERAEKALAAAETELKTLKVKAAKARAELTEVEALAAQAATLAGAEARLAVHVPNAEAARAELRRLEEEHAALGPIEEVPPSADLGPARSVVARAQAEAKAAHAELARAEQRLEQAVAAAERARELESERVNVEADLSDYLRLAHDLGRDGIQSAEVDSAGPELTELVNDLLHTCHGPRFTVSVETTRLSATGKDQVDECTILVTDTEGGGRIREASKFSGGEKVLLGEAMALGLTMLACRRAGLVRPTLFRDESGGALDADNRRAYVAMWRRAVDVIGADRVLFVSQSEDMIECADARILIGNDALKVLGEAA